MVVNEIIAQIDAEIARLEQARKLLSRGPNVHVGNVVAQKSGGRTRRPLSAEARKRIAEAQRKRWAAQKAKK